jgi:hypothetical protein
LIFLKKFKTHDITIYSIHPGFFLSALCINKTRKILTPKK